MAEHKDSTQPEGVSRRKALGIGAAAVGVAAVSTVVGSAVEGAVAHADPSPFPVAPAGSTLAQTLLHGPPGAKGYRHVVPGSGEPSLPRYDLVGTPAATGTRTSLLSFVQLTDMHIVDAQSPLRLEFTDRFSDPDNQLHSVSPFSSAYRPQEMLSAHVAEAMVKAVNALGGGGVGPVTARPLDFTICTGDNSDNTQYNEVRWHIDILDGHQPVRPDSGNYGKWEGVGGGNDYDTHYWHPDGTPFLGQVDKQRGTYGFPTVPGLLNRCRAPFTATGLNTPWYACFGNHDGLVQGNLPGPTLLTAIATGRVKVIGLPAGVDVPGLAAALQAGNPAALQALEILFTAGAFRIVTADKNRRPLSHKQTMTEYLNTTGAPSGHGYTPAAIAADVGYYSVIHNNVVCISLDTVDPAGYDDGSIDKAQLDWLKGQLQANSSRYLDANGQWVSSPGTDRLVLIFSHHTSKTMENLLGVNRHNGNELVATLLSYPNVIGWVNGHTHVNSVTSHLRASGAAFAGGFWEINTASHIDWPSQSRAIEVVDNGNGSVSIFGTLVDHAAPAAWPANPSTPIQLASLARELAINDPQRDAETASRDGKRGTIADRNVELLVNVAF